MTDPATATGFELGSFDDACSCGEAMWMNPSDSDRQRRRKETRLVTPVTVTRRRAGACVARARRGSGHSAPKHHVLPSFAFPAWPDPRTQIARPDGLQRFRRAHDCNLDALRSTLNSTWKAWPRPLWRRNSLCPRDAAKAHADSAQIRREPAAQPAIAPPLAVRGEGAGCCSCNWPAWLPPARLRACQCSGALA